MHDLVIRGATIADGTGRPTFVGDVAVDGRDISEVGAVDGRGRRELDGDGLVLAPGWVDIHTHYDGQVSWDPELTPSSWHGVTTVVMGNCGVGFAPVRPGEEDFLVELMESVEDIPGTALHEGIDWGWETFEEYLDSLDTKRTVMDVAAQVPHCAVRAYVMGERAHDDATHDEIAEMAVVVERAMRAGAAGFSTSRTVLHRSRHGYVPGTAAPADELLAIGDALGTAGHGVFQMVSDTVSTEPERMWMADLARRTGATVTYALAQARPGAAEYRDALRPRGTARRRRASRRAAGVFTPDRHALRAAVVAAPLHHPSDLSLDRAPAVGGAGGEAAAARGAVRAAGRGTGHEERHRHRAHVEVGTSSSRSAIRRTTSLRRRAARPRLPSARGVAAGSHARLDARARRHRAAVRAARQLRRRRPRGLARDDDPPADGPRPGRRRRTLRADLRRQHDDAIC